MPSFAAKSAFWKDLKAAVTEHLAGEASRGRPSVGDPRLQTLQAQREQGFRAITIIDPGVKFEPGYDVFDEAAACRPSKTLWLTGFST